MTPTELQAQNERVNRSIQLQRLTKPALYRLLKEQERRHGIHVLSNPVGTKQELANRICEYEAR